MSRKQVFLAAAILCGGLAATGSAYAFGITVGPGGVEVDPGYHYDYDNHHYDDWGISADEAVDIARRHGVRNVRSVNRRGRTYEVSGWDRHHDFIRVTIDRRDGDVVDVDR